MTTLFAPSICLVDDQGVGQDELVAAAAALSKQVEFDYAPLWGFIATVRASTPDLPPRDDEWVLRVQHIDLTGALGYHDETDQGNPLLYVDKELCEQDGASWTSCASHEILESLSDALLNWCCQSPIDGKIWAMEICDAVETDTYKIDGIDVSNFVTRQYWSPPKDLTGVRLDVMGLVKSPFEIRPGGYGQTFDTNAGWQQVGAMRPYRQKLFAAGMSRGARRAT